MSLVKLAAIGAFKAELIETRDGWIIDDGWDGLHYCKTWEDVLKQLRECRNMNNGTVLENKKEESK